MALSVDIVRTDDEKAALYRFRYRVYVEEMGLAPPDADHANQQLRDAHDDWAVSHVLWQDGEVVGSLRCIFLDEVPDPAPFVEKFQLAPALDAFGARAIATTSRFMIDHRLRGGRGIFSLMEAAFLQAAERNVRLNYGDCSPHLLPFYEHLGYRRYTRAYNDWGYGFKVPILMLVRDRERFEQVRSPLARVMRHAADDAEARAWFERTYTDYLGLESAPLITEGDFLDALASRVAADPLHALALLHGLSREEADVFLADATSIQAAPGDRLIRQGERGDTLFVLLSGLAEVLVDGPRPRPVALLGAGDVFGEIGFLTARPRTANVVAAAPSEVLVLSGPFLQRFIARHAEVGAKVLLNLSRILAARLADTTLQAGPIRYAPR